MTAPVLWSDLQVPGQAPVPMTADIWDGNFTGLDGRLAPIEQRRLDARGLGELAVVRDGQAVSIPLTDGSGADAHNLPVARFEPRGAWATGTAYARGDLVSVGSRSAVATVDHVAGTWADDVAALRWAVNSGSGDWLSPRGVYDPGAVYAVGDAVLYSADGGVRWQLWRGSVGAAGARAIPAGAAPGAVDADGFPYWSAETVLPRERQITLRAKGSVPTGLVAARRLALPISIPAVWAGSGVAIQPFALSALSMELRVDGIAVATMTVAPQTDHAALVGAGGILIGAGSLIELVNLGRASTRTTSLSLGIAGTYA